VLPGIETRVATTGHLIALKLLSVSDRRPQDQVDLVGLIGVATSADLAVAKAAIRLIAVRGYSRGRDLEAAFKKLKSTVSGEG
jgi:hypothetical protein